MSDGPLDRNDSATISIGMDRYVRFYKAANGESGITYEHPIGPRGSEIPPEMQAFPGRCLGGAYFGPSGWTLESRDPLTISPSLACSCGDHGFIRGGQWVPA